MQLLQEFNHTFTFSVLQLELTLVRNLWREQPRFFTLTMSASLLLLFVIVK